MEELIKELEYAKNATQSCLKSANCNVDMHGLSYWANEVERLRKEIDDRDRVLKHYKEEIESYKRNIEDLSKRVEVLENQKIIL